MIYFAYHLNIDDCACYYYIVKVGFPILERSQPWLCARVVNSQNAVERRASLFVDMG